MATEGSGQASRCCISSRAESTQPTVPSPPHTSTRKRGTWENTWSLVTGRQELTATSLDRTGKPGQEVEARQPNRATAHPHLRAPAVPAPTPTCPHQTPAGV